MNTFCGGIFFVCFVFYFRNRSGCGLFCCIRTKGEYSPEWKWWIGSSTFWDVFSRLKSNVVVRWWALHLIVNCNYTTSINEAWWKINEMTTSEYEMNSSEKIVHRVSNSIHHLSTQFQHICERMCVRWWSTLRAILLLFDGEFSNLEFYSKIVLKLNHLLSRSSHLTMRFDGQGFRVAAHGVCSSISTNLVA